MFRKKKKAILDDDVEIIEPLTRLTDLLYKNSKKVTIWKSIGRISAAIFGFAFGFSLSALTITGWALHTTIIAAIGLPFIIPAIVAIPRLRKLSKESAALEMDIMEREREEIFNLSHSHEKTYDYDPRLAQEEQDCLDSVQETLNALGVAVKKARDDASKKEEEGLISRMIETNENSVEDTPVNQNNNDSNNSPNEDVSSSDEINI